MTSQVLPPGAEPIGSSGHPTLRSADTIARSAVPRSPGLLLAWAIGLALLSGVLYLAPGMAAWLLVLVGAGVPAARLVWSRPELGLVAISFFTASLVPRELITFSLAGLRLDPTDIILLGLLALLVVQGLRRNTMEIPRWSICGPLVAFAGFAVFSALYAWSYQGVQLGLAVGELRPAMYCAGCAIATALIVRRQQLTVLLAGLFIVADLTAGAVILQQFVSGQTSLVPTPASGVWQIDHIGGSGGGFGAVRVVPPGHVLMYLMANVAFCLVLGPLRTPWVRAFLALQLAFLGVGLLLTYTRAQWIASGIAVLLACALLPRAAKTSLGRLLLLVVPILALAVGLVGTGLVSVGGAGAGEALVSRAASIFTPDDTLDTASLEWRVFEVEAAGRALSEQPFLGVGLGNDYRDVTLLQGEASGWLWQLDGSQGRLTRFVHNSYLYVAVKMGLVALGVFLWFCLAFLMSGARAYFSLPDSPAKLIVLAIVCSFAGLLEWAVFIAHFMLPASMATLGLMVGIVAVVGSRHVAMKDAGDALGNAQPGVIVS